MLAAFKKNIKIGWVNFFRNSAISIATCFIIGMTIFVISFLFLIKDVSDFFVTDLREKADMSVYFQESTEEELMFSLIQEISALEEVKEVKYVSKSEALEKFMEENKDNTIIMESLTEVGNRFLPSLNIKAHESGQYETIVNFINSKEDISFIEKIDYLGRKEVIETIFSITSAVNTVGIILSILFGSVAIMVAYNQIRLAIYNSREEIKIQRLVGASNWFIRGPFLAQGAISGFLATIATILFLWLTTLLLSPKFAILFSGFNIFETFVNQFWFFFFLQLLVGVGLGIISSIIAMRKFLEV